MAVMPVARSDSIRRTELVISIVPMQTTDQLRGMYILARFLTGVCWKMMSEVCNGWM